MMGKAVGLTLVEFMVALLITSLLVVIGGNILQQQLGAWRFHLTEQHLQEQGNLLAHALKQEIQHAGLSLKPPGASAALADSTGDAWFSDITFSSKDITDCLGRNFPETNGQSLRNRFYVREASDSEEDSLYCRAHDGEHWQEVELVRGVVLFLVRVAAQQGSQVRFYAVEDFPEHADITTMQIAVVLKENVPARFGQAYSYMDPWGNEYQFNEKALYQSFVIHAEVLNG